MSRPTTFNRHYPFAQRDWSFVFPWDVDRLALPNMVLDSELPKGDGIDLFGDDITLLIEEPDLVPASFPPHYGERKTLNYKLDPNPPAGWAAINPAFPNDFSFLTASNQNTAQIRFLFQVRNQSSGTIDLQRPNRRVHKLEFGIATRFRMNIQATRFGGGTLLFNYEGYWRNDADAVTPGFPDAYWQEADTPPTLHRLHQKGHRDYHRAFAPGDWVETKNEIGGSAFGGSGLGALEDYLQDWLDDIIALIATTTVNATWRLAGIGWGLPTTIGNRTFITQSSEGDRY